MMNEKLSNVKLTEGTDKAVTETIKAVEPCIKEIEPGKMLKVGGAALGVVVVLYGTYKVLDKCGVISKVKTLKPRPIKKKAKQTEVVSNPETETDVDETNEK